MFLSLFIYTVIMSYTPGPNNLLALDATTKFGFKKSMPLLIGIGSGFLLIAFISLVLSDYLQNIFSQFEFLIKIIGSLYLIYLAICTLKSQKNKKDGHNLTFMKGLTLQFLNPKTILYVFTAVSAYVVSYHFNLIYSLTLTIFIALIGFSASITWGAMGYILQSWIKRYNVLYRIVMFALLIYMAITILID